MVHGNNSDYHNIPFLSYATTFNNPETDIAYPVTVSNLLVVQRSVCCYPDFRQLSPTAMFTTIGISSLTTPSISLTTRAFILSISL